MAEQGETEAPANPSRGGSQSGGCLCGGVRYEADGPLRPVIACHCEQCRKTSGHFVAATAVARDRLRILVADTLAWYESSATARRGFCTRCGSSLFWDCYERPTMGIMAGSLEPPTGLEIESHIHTEDASDYYRP